jgi:hypothetical protein
MKRFIFAAAAICTLNLANAQTLRIQVLYGKTGKPVANEHVNIFRGEGFGDLAENKGVRGFNTDADGVITTSDIAQDVHAFYVFVDWHRQCSRTIQVKFPLDQVFEKGVVSENTCKPKLQRTAEPGTLILFVRDETLFEKMAH